MKKVRSKPFSSSQTFRLVKRKHPATISTSRTSSRCQAPIISGLKTLDFGNIKVRPSDEQSRLHKDVFRQQDPRLRLPSGKTVRPPKMLASGCDMANPSRLSTAPWWHSVSGLSSSSHSVSTRFAATLFPAAKPKFSLEAISST